jgi:transcriptional regulator with PAS, ATPase and Fis domain
MRATVATALIVSRRSVTVQPSISRISLVPEHALLPRRPGQSGPYAEPVIIRSSAAFREALVLADRVAAGEAKVLLTGESGVGKDLIARYIHARSRRARHAFVAVNCAAVSDSLLESELFGHARGSFTGAYRDKPGVLELAHGGTVFLDEIGEMSLRMQALLLRFLENGEIQPVGSDLSRTRVDARVIAATNRNLSDLVAGGGFREDLLYRVQVGHIHVPPLRQRREDIRPLVEHTLSRTGKRLEFTPQAWAALESYAWPGNVRELQNTIEQLAWMSGLDLVDVAHLAPAMRAGGRTAVYVRERRRQLADDLLADLVAGRKTFWEHIHPAFLDRDLTRHDIRELVRKGLMATGGSYRALVALLRLPPGDYKRFLNFISAHQCGIDARAYRTGAAAETADGPAPPPGPSI